MKRPYYLAGLLAVFPAAVSAQPLLPSQDSFVVIGNNTNNGSQQQVIVTNTGNGGQPTEGLVQFDLTSLPAGLTASQISHATLTLFISLCVANSWSLVFSTSCKRGLRVNRQVNAMLGRAQLTNPEQGKLIPANG